MNPTSTDARREALAPILAAALRAVDAREAVRSHMEVRGSSLRIGKRAYNLDEIGRLVVVGTGKAGAPMAAAVWELLGERVADGSVNVKYGHMGGAGGWRIGFGSGGGQVAPPGKAQTGRIAIHEAGH